MSNIGVTPGYTPEQIERNLEGFKFGLTFDQVKIKQIRNRDPVAYFLTTGIVKEALGDGFTLTDLDGNPIPNLDEWEKFLEETDFLSNLKIFISDIYAYGSAGGLIFANGELHSFEPLLLEITFDYRTRIMTKVVCNEFFAFANIEQAKHTIPITNTEADPFLYGIIDKGSKTFQGISKLEKVWDIINALWIIDFMASMYAARMGAGIKIVKAGTKDKDERDSILTDLRDLNWKGGIVIDIEDDFSLYTGEGSIDFDKLKNILYDSLASATGIPKTKWRGEVPGELSAGKINRKSYIDVLVQTQADAKPFVTQFIKIIAALQNIPLPNMFQVEWNYKEEPTEREKAEIENIQSNSLTNMANFMTGREIREKFNLEELEFFQISDQIPLNILISQNSSKIQIGLGDTTNVGTDSEQPIGNEQQTDNKTDNINPEQSGPEPESRPESTAAAN